MQLVDALPKRVCPEVPMMKTKAVSVSTQCLLDFYVNKYLLPNCTTWLPPLGKFHTILRGMAIYGLQIAMAELRRDDDNQVVVDFTIPYMGDVVLERGAVSAYTADYVFIREKYTEAGLEQIYKQESRRRSTNWNLGNLRKVINSQPNSQSELQGTRPLNEDQTSNEVRYTLVRAFQKGKGAKQYRFDADSGLVVTEETLKGLNGELPIIPFYFDYLTGTPYGYGLAERLYEKQVELDTTHAQYFNAKFYHLSPALIQKGKPLGDETTLTPNGLIELPADSDAQIAPLVIDTPFHQLHNDDTAHLKEQTLRIAGSPNTAGGASIAAESKTAAGVRQRQARTDVSDNTVRKNFEYGLSKLTNLLIAYTVANRRGKEWVRVDRDVISKLTTYKEYRQTKDQVFIPLNDRGQEDKKAYRVRFSKGYAEAEFNWNFIQEEFQESQVELDVSWELDKQEQIENLMLFMERTSADPRLDNVVHPQRAAKYLGKLFGLPETIFRKEEEDQQQQVASVPMVQEMIDEALNQYTNEKQTDSFIEKNFADLPEDTKMAVISERMGITPQAPSPVKREIDIKQAQVTGQLDQAAGGVQPAGTNPQDQVPQGEQEILDLVEQAEANQIGDDALAQLMIIKQQLDVARSEATSEEELAQLEDSAADAISNLILKNQGKGELTKTNVA